MMSNPMIKQELLQYVARLVETHPLQSNKEPKAVRHDVSALLVEQALDLSEENGRHDLFIAKPILRAALILIKDRIKLIESQEEDLALMELREKYLQTINTLEKILVVLK